MSRIWQSVRCWFGAHVNAWHERSLLGVPLYPVECDHCGELFYMGRGQ